MSTGKARDPRGSRRGSTSRITRLMPKRSRTPAFFDRARIEAIVRLIYEGLPVPEQDATMARSMEVYERIHAAYDDLYDPRDVEQTRVRDLSGSGTTVVTAVAIFCLYEALSDAQLNAYKPIYGGRKRVTGVFHNDVYYLLKSKDLRMINYAGVSAGILWCFDNQMVRALHKELDASEELRSAHCIVGEFSSRFEVCPIRTTRTRCASSSIARSLRYSPCDRVSMSPAPRRVSAPRAPMRVRTLIRSFNTKNRPI